MVATDEPDGGEPLASRVVAWVLVLGALALAVLSLAPPEVGGAPLESGYDPVRGRALQARLAAEPHPVGSSAHAAVRALLLEELAAAGLELELQRGLVRGRELTNVLARLPATGPLPSTGTLLLAAHYDTVPGSPVPIAWGALSGLATDPTSDARLYAVHDSFYRQSRFFEIDASSSPARIRKATVVRDATGKLSAALQALVQALPPTATGDLDVAAIVEADGTVNLDLEGIAAAADGTLWLASEGTGNLTSGVSDPSDRPFERPNLLLQVDRTGAILDVVLPPQALTEQQLRFGFEGLAVEDGAVYVAFQREWKGAGDPSGLVRIGRYDLGSGTWGFAHYPLDGVSSPNGGWVGLSDLVSLGGGRFAVVERDNQGGPDAAVKRLYSFDTTGVSFLDESQVASFPVLAKGLAVDLLAAGTFAPFGGLVPEKIEGLTVLSDGTALIVNDNDGVDDNSGETLLIGLPQLFQ
jgi:hypothetical protein